MKFGLVGWGFIVGAAGLITFIIILTQIARNRSFLKRSESVTGAVTGKFSHYANNNHHYTLDVEYMVDGVTYKRSVTAARSEYTTLERGAPIDLKYKPGRPKKIVRADSLTEKNMKALNIMAVVSAALTVAGAVMIAATWL